MKGAYQEFLGVILSFLGVSLILSTFIPKLIQGASITFSQNDLISIIIGAILSYIGYKGVKNKW